jgi:hypothetical protein
MDLIVEMQFGSHLYGTATPQSDLDFKAVYLPDARDILLQRVQNTITHAPDKPDGEKNAPGDVDREIHSLQRYLELLAEGQTMALDMLFAPESAMTRPPSALWLEIQANAPRLVTRRASAFLRYCRQQANKYGIKGSRVSAARQALAVLVDAEAKYGTAAKLAVAESELEASIGTSEHEMLIDLPTPADTLVRHFEVCGKKMPFTSLIKSAREIAQRGWVVKRWNFSRRARSRSRCLARPRSWRSNRVHGHMKRSQKRLIGFWSMWRKLRFRRRFAKSPTSLLWMTWWPGPTAVRCWARHDRTFASSH